VGELNTVPRGNSGL